MARWFFKTQDQIVAERAKRIERERDKTIRRECEYYMQLIPQVVARCGINHWLPMSQRPNVLEKQMFGAVPDMRIRIVESRYTEHAIYLWVDPRYLPYGHSIPELYSDEVLETLSIACGRQVDARSEAGSGFWYVVWREGARNAIPVNFPYNDAISMIPDNAPPLYYIAGVAENNRVIHLDLETLPHLLVAGSTYTGKSVHLNQLICQLISRNTPADLRLTMIDLKGGSEFGFYEGLPHLARPIVSRPEDVPDVLAEFHSTMESRMTDFAFHHVKTIQGWNKKFPDQKLSYEVLLFDEIASVMTDPNRQLVKNASAWLAKIMATSRSTGGHVVLCTQSPRTDIIPPWIKNNANGRLCFAVPSNTDSIVVIDNGAASKIDTDIPGRAILRAGPRLTEVQSPWISNERIYQIVREVITGHQEPSEKLYPPGLAEILEVAVDDYGGKLNYMVLCKAQALKGKIGRDKIRDLLSTLNGGPIYVRGVEYRKKNPGKGKHGGAYLEPVVKVDPLSSRFKDAHFGQSLPRWIFKHVPKHETSETTVLRQDA